MPELPEVEIIKRQLEDKILEKEITDISLSDKKMRFSPDKSLIGNLIGEKITTLIRRNKYIVIETQNYFLVFHLGMSGQIKIKSLSDIHEKHQHVSIIFSNFILSLVDPRRFGGFLIYDKKKIKKIENIALFKSLGIEPFSNNYTLTNLKKLIKNNKENIKHFLLNAHNICGIGNIYASEILFESKISPYREVQTLTTSETTLLYHNIKKVLQKAIDNGGSSISDYIHINGQSGNMQNLYYVYSRDKKDCRICGTKILKQKQFGRSTFFCPHCQI